MSKEKWKLPHNSKLQRSVDEKFPVSMVKEDFAMITVAGGSAGRSVHFSQPQFDKSTWDQSIEIYV